MQYCFTQAGAGLLLHQLRTRYAEDGSESVMAVCVRELRDHFTRYEAVLGKDIEQLFRQ
ncbi:MAG: hypothetical protein WC360_02595 [Opitutales bacterium]